MDGWLEEFIYCSPRVTASGKDPTQTLKDPSRGGLIRNLMLGGCMYYLRETLKPLIYFRGVESTLAVIGTGGPVK